jgi:hypothetical protein
MSAPISPDLIRSLWRTRRPYHAGDEEFWSEIERAEHMTARLTGALDRLNSRFRELRSVIMRRPQRPI